MMASIAAALLSSHPMGALHSRTPLLHVQAQPVPKQGPTPCTAVTKLAAVPCSQLWWRQFIHYLRMLLQVLPDSCHPICKICIIQEAVICLWTEPFGGQHTVP